jgi:hypothetical protein
MANRELTDDEKRELRNRFAAAGLSAIQISLASNGISHLVDYPWNSDSRGFAKLWVAEELERTHRAARRSARYLRWGTAAAIIAALAAMIAAIPIVERWIQWAHDAL